MRWDQIEAEWAAMARRVCADVQHSKILDGTGAQPGSVKVGSLGSVAVPRITPDPAAIPGKRETVTSR
jgi:hypothetical protein